MAYLAITSGPGLMARLAGVDRSISIGANIFFVAHACSVQATFARGGTLEK